MGRNKSSPKCKKRNKKTEIVDTLYNVGFFQISAAFKSNNPEVKNTIRKKINMKSVNIIYHAVDFTSLSMMLPFRLLVGIIIFLILIIMC